MNTTVLNVTEGYSYLWQKAHAGVLDLYQHHQGFDWYLKADDDTYIIMENLKLFLSDKDPDDPVYYGAKFKQMVKQVYYSIALKSYRKMIFL